MKANPGWQYSLRYNYQILKQVQDDSREASLLVGNWQVHMRLRQAQPDNEQEAS
jgi:hypothetical protein